MEAECLKITVIGNKSVGKTSFLSRLHEGKFPTEYIPPSSFPAGDHLYSLTFLLDNGKAYAVQFYEPTPPQGYETFNRIRPLSYPMTDLFIVCYDVGNRETFECITDELIAEVKANMPETPILLLGNKTDVRANNHNIKETDAQVTYQEGCDVAQAVDAICVECSALTCEGVHDVAHIALYMAVYGQKPRKHSFFRRKQQSLRPNIVFAIDSLVLVPTGVSGMGNAPVCQVIEILPSTTVEEFAKIRHDSSCTDARFTFQDNSAPVDAHQIILVTAAPTLFQDILTGPTKRHVSGAPQELFEKVSWPVNAAKNGKSDQIDNQKHMVKIKVSDRIPREEFLKLLEFLYLGPSVTHLKDNSQVFLNELVAVAKRFQLTELLRACENVLEGNEEENIKKASFSGGEKATVLKNLFFNKPLLDDLVFVIGGEEVYAHKAVVKARCQVLTDVLDDHCKKHGQCIRTRIEIHDTSLKTFSSLLQYLYTDDVIKGIDQSDLMELMGLANTYRLPRLITLCEYHLIKKVEQEEDIHAAVDCVIDILQQSKIHGAQQLPKWCLNLIARNYAAFASEKKFSSLSEEDRSYVVAHQWPVLCKLSASHAAVVEEYIDRRKRLFRTESTTSCKVM